MVAAEAESLHDLLQVVLAKYPEPEEIYNTARNDAAENYDISDWSSDYRRELLVDTAETVFNDLSVTDSYEFIPSRGQQNAPNIPYFAFTNTVETDSVQYGRDVVYLVSLLSMIIFDPVKNFFVSYNAI